MLKLAGLIALVVLAPVGLFCLAFLLRLGMAQSLEVYGSTFTVLVSAGIVPVFLAIAYLFDRRQGQERHTQEARRSDWQ